jgi:hypothetical protein
MYIETQKTAKKKVVWQEGPCCCERRCYLLRALGSTGESGQPRRKSPAPEGREEAAKHLLACLRKPQARIKHKTDTIKCRHYLHGADKSGLLSGRNFTLI